MDRSRESNILVMPPMLPLVPRTVPQPQCVYHAASKLFVQLWRCVVVYLFSNQWLLCGCGCGCGYSCCCSCLVHFILRYTEEKHRAVHLGHDGPVHSIDWSHNSQSQLLLTASTDGSAKIWQRGRADQQQTVCCCPARSSRSCHEAAMCSHRRIPSRW